MVEQMDKSKLSASSRIQSSDKQQDILDKQDQYLRTNVIDVFGKETEHGFRIRKHPSNSAAGAYFLLHHN
jgi:hypothetical protein